MASGQSAGTSASQSDGSLPARDFRVPLGPRLLSLFGSVFLGAVGLGMVALTVAAFLARQWLVGIVVALCAAVVIELTRYVARDLSGKSGLRVACGADSVDLVLPANRSLIHKAPRQQITVPYSDIAAIETRLEAYASMGMANMQRAYVLRRKGGERIFLFEERALGTGLQSNYFGGAVEEIARRAHAPVEDLGMVKGDNGLLGVWATHPADWASPALSKSDQQRLWGRAIATGRWAFLLILLAFAVRALFALHG